MPTYDISVSETIVLVETPECSNTWFPLSLSEDISLVEDCVEEGDYYTGTVYNIVCDAEIIDLTESNSVTQNLNNESIVLVEDNTFTLLGMLLSETIDLVEEATFSTTVHYITAEETIALTEHVADIQTLRRYTGTDTGRTPDYLDHTEWHGNYGLESILPVPLFGNTEAFEHSSKARTNKFGETIILNNSDLPVLQKYVLQFTNVTQSQLDDFKTFLKYNIGEVHNFTDYENRTLALIIENNLVVEEIANIVPRDTEEVCGPLYNMQLVLRGLYI